MNEQIEQLAKQCYVKTGSPHTDHFEYWKFAELIVVKCANVVWDEAHNTNNKEVNEVGYKILEHFGIK